MINLSLGCKHASFCIVALNTKGSISLASGLFDHQAERLQLWTIILNSTFYFIYFYASSQATAMDAVVSSVRMSIRPSCS